MSNITDNSGRNELLRTAGGVIVCHVKVAKLRVLVFVLLAAKGLPDNIIGISDRRNSLRRLSIP